MSDPHLHEVIGKAIYGCKKQFFRNLKGGMDLKSAIAQFMLELQRALSDIATEQKGELS